MSDPRLARATMPAPAMPFEDAATRLASAREALHRVIFGQQALVDRLLLTVVAGVHALIEGVPGLAKTLAVRSLANVVALPYARVQLTPDLLPSDLTGTMSLDSASGVRRRHTWSFRKGPVFTSLLLADEINRTPPKTQVALLEAMAKRSVTVAGTTHALPDLFCVFATQNPVEHRGTYPLSALQRDRFALFVPVHYPDPEAEARLIACEEFPDPSVLSAAWDADTVRALRHCRRSVVIPRAVLAFLVRCLRLTRPETPNAPDLVRRFVALGAGPRAIEHFVPLLQGQALFAGRPLVTFNDVEDLFPDVVHHRLVLQPQAAAEGVSARHVALSVLDGERRLRSQRSHSHVVAHVLQP